MKKSNKRFFVTLFPNGYTMVSKSLTRIAKKQGLNVSHISACLNHPEERYSHRGYKFKWMDKRIKLEKTANRHVVNAIKDL